MHRLLYVLPFTLTFALGCWNSSETTGTEDAANAKQTNQNPVADEKLASFVGKMERIETGVKNAIVSGDFVAAKQGIKKGLDHLGEDDGFAQDRARFLLLLGTVDRESGREVEARRHFDDAMAIFHVGKNAAGKFETYLALGNLEARRGDYAASQRHYSSAEELMPSVEDRALKGSYLEHTARLASRQVDHQKAKDGFLEAIKLFEEINNKRQVAENLLLLASEEDALTRGPACLRHLRRANGIFKELENLDGQSRAVHRMAAMAEREKKYKKARQLFVQVADLYDELDRTTAATKVRQHLNSLPEPQ